MKLSARCVQQRFRLLQIRRVKALGKPAVDRRQQRTGFGLLALLLPQTAQAYGGPQLQCPRLVTAGHRQGLVETRLGCCSVRHVIPRRRMLEPGLQQQLSLECDFSRLVPQFLSN